MERPEVIKQKIKELEELLVESKKYYDYELVCSSDVSDDMIGFFNMGNLRKILTLLVEGKTLQYRHEFYGTVDVRMNPQLNRIICSLSDKFDEDNIIKSMILYSGKWYVKNS
jgi:hypothetical protein